MLTIITGTPGAGKTAYAVAQLAELLEREPNRPVIVMGIPELKLPHQVASPVEEWTRRVPTPEDPEILEAEFTFPEGALVIVDEAQKVFRPRAPTAKVPDHVSAFEKHRHRGLDFWLLTQHPNLMDAALRRLCGKHVHLRGHWAGRELLEWPEASDPDSRASRATAVRRRYTLPKKAFSLYKSASLHIKQSRRIPLALYVFAAVVAIAGFLGWRMFNRVSDAIAGRSDYSGPAAAQQRREGPVSAAGGPSAMSPMVLSPATFTPRLMGRPESAPLYDSIRQVRAMPTVVGCMTIGPRCSCYTEQGTDAGLDDAQCRAWLRSPPFNPWREAASPATRPSSSSSSPGAPEGG